MKTIVFITLVFCASLCLPSLTVAAVFSSAPIGSSSISVFGEHLAGYGSLDGKKKRKKHKVYGVRKQPKWRSCKSAARVRRKHDRRR